MTDRAKGILTGGRQLDREIQENAARGNLFQRVINAVNTLAGNLGGSAVGRSPAPPPITGMNVAVGGEYAHITLQHPGEIQQGVHYFVEVANNPNFTGAHPIHYGTSRTRDPIHLAPKDSNGVAQKWYARAYAQYPGSDPTPPLVYGGASPKAISTTGTTQLTWNTSTGSGTGANNGQQPGVGFGKIQRRK